MSSLFHQKFIKISHCLDGREVSSQEKNFRLHLPQFEKIWWSRKIWHHAPNFDIENRMYQSSNRFCHQPVLSANMWGITRKHQMVSATMYHAGRRQKPAKIYEKIRTFEVCGYYC